MIEKIILVTVTAILTCNALQPLEERLAVWKQEMPLTSLEQLQKLRPLEKLVSMYQEQLRKDYDGINMLPVDEAIHFCSLPDAILHEIKAESLSVSSGIDEIERALRTDKDSFIRGNHMTEAEHAQALVTLQAFQHKLAAMQL